MKQQYFKVDRATGEVLSRRHFDDPQRDMRKSVVWFPVVVDPAVPAFDSSVEVLEESIIMPSLTSTSKASKITRRMVIRAKTQAEINSEAVGELDATATADIRLVEDFFDALVASGVLTMDDLPAKAQARLARRKTVRGRIK